MKKGFTLVELLAVIVIMSIILLIAIPNVIEALNSAKQKSFINDVNNVHNTAKNQFNLDKSRGKIRYKTYNGERYGVYCFGVTPEEDALCEGASELSLENGGSNLRYKVMVHVTGRVDMMYVDDGRFYLSCTNDYDCERIEEANIFDIASVGDMTDEMIESKKAIPSGPDEPA